MLATWITLFGPLLIPGTDLITGAGKASVFYVMHTEVSAMKTGNGQIVQSLANNGESRQGCLLEPLSGVVDVCLDNGCDF
jgi:hypothetical protein